jgi:translation elongation factor EF-Tu-like GTPase
VDGGLLSARQFIFRKSLSGNWVEDVATLAGKTLEVVGDIDVGHVRRGISRVCLGLLFFPTRVEQFN